MVQITSRKDLIRGPLEHNFRGSRFGLFKKIAIFG